MLSWAKNSVQRKEAGMLPKANEVSAQPETIS